MSAAGSTLSRFTPSVMKHELLERLFVARERTLDSIMARIGAAATSAERNHTLLVGARGSGKTHLVSLAYHRTGALRAAGARLQVAWLPEDPWTIVSYRHLLTAVAERLEPAVDGEVPRSADDLESLLARRAAEGGPVVVLVENFDRILAALKDDGQQRLRHLLQADRSLLLVATSTRLDRALSDQARPFYGFFTTTRLEPFDVDQAAAMLAAIAAERGDRELVEYLGGEDGRARLRTISHLAGGQPRMWAALASALTVGGLDELVDLLLTRFDDLTPYYQEQLGRLSPQERLVVAELAGEDRPINVSELAERLEVGQRSLAKTIGELVDRGWAAPTSSPQAALLDRRRTYYELAEPLARLSFQIKESRGEPLRVVVDFLKHWFDPGALGASESEGMAAEYVLLASAGHARDPVVAVTRQLQRLPISRVPTVELLGEIDDALAALEGGDPEPFLRLPVPVRVALEGRLEADDVFAVRIEIHRVAGDEFGRTRHPEMARWIESAEELIGTVGGHRKPVAQLVLADWLGRAWRFDEAVEVIQATAVAVGRPHVAVLDAREGLAMSYWHAGRWGEAIELGEVVIGDCERVLGRDDQLTLVARANLASSYVQAGRNGEAIELVEAVVDDSRRVFGPDDHRTLAARSNLAVSYWRAERIGDAIELAEAVLRDTRRVLGGNDPGALAARAVLALSYARVDRIEEAIALEEAVVRETQAVLRPDHPHALAARGNLATAYWKAGRTSEARELEEAVLRDKERILGSDHPDTLTARGNLATSYRAAGRTREAIELEEAVLRDRLRVLGPDHPDTVTARANLAATYRDAGRPADADALEPP